MIRRDGQSDASGDRTMWASAASAIWSPGRSGCVQYLEMQRSPCANQFGAQRQARLRTSVSWVFRP